MLTVLFCLGDPTNVQDTKMAFPFIQIFVDSAPNIPGATVMTAVVLILTWNCAIGIVTTASRVTWSFARDRGTPFSAFISKVNSRTQVPGVAVGMVTTFAALLTLIYVGSDTAFNDVISLTITGFYGSYFLPAAFLLYHRITGNILYSDAGVGNARVESGTNLGSEIENGASTGLVGKGDGSEKREQNDPTTATNADVQEGIAQARLIWGPWRLPGILGIINNTYACCYMIFVIFWSFWPPATPVSASSMNYSVLVTGGVIIFSIIWYLIRGRKEYKGPTIDEEVKVIMRLGSIAGIKSVEGENKT